MSQIVPTWLKSKLAGLSALVAATLLVSAAHQFTSPTQVYEHNFLEVLYYAPTVFGALLFGWRAGLGIAVLATASHVPYILRMARESPDYAIEQSIEMPLLCAVGTITGILSDRDRRQRRDLEQTTRKLTEVYRELQQNFEQMKRAERLFAVGQLAAGLAHELRNPLWSVNGAVGILQRSAPLEPKYQECLDIISKETQRLSRLLTEFLDFARPRPPKFQRVDVDMLLNSVAQLAGHGVGNSSVRLRKVTTSDLPPIHGDSEMIRQLLLNLVINAVQAMPEGGEVLLSASQQGADLTIRVQDEGTGIAPEIRDKIFDPFFTTKNAGTGLGLAVAHRIVEQHGGTLKAEANPGRGMTFSAILPIYAEESR